MENRRPEMQKERMPKVECRKRTQKKDYSAPVLQKRQKLAEVMQGDLIDRVS
jgi:hypothetical protein